MKSDKIISIGIDPSTKTGIAVLQFDKTLGNYEPLLKDVFKSPKDGSGILRADVIAVRIYDLVRDCKLKYGSDPIVVIEGYGFGQASSIRILVEIGTMIRFRLHDLGISYIEVAPTALKKFVTGKGNAKKELMLLEVYKRWGIDCETNDEADAVGLGMYGLAVNGLITVPKIHLAKELINQG